MFTLIAAQLYHSGSCFTSCARALATSVRSGGTLGAHRGSTQALPGLSSLLSPLLLAIAASSSGRTPQSLSCHSDGLQALQQTACLRSETSYWEQMILIKGLCRNLRMKWWGSRTHTASSFSQMLFWETAAGQQSTGKYKAAQLVHTGTGFLCHFLAMHVKQWRRFLVI